MVTNVSPSWSDRRQELRSLVAIHAYVRGPGHAGRVIELNNISCSGCSLHDRRFFKGDQLWICFPGLSPVRATVRWSDESGAGVSFGHRLSRYVLEHISRGR